MIKRKNIVILGCVSALSVSIYLLFSYLQNGIGFPLDDSWIHQTYARNLANGDGWSFVPGQNSAGLTAPLWGLLLSFGYHLALGPYIFAFILGWLILWVLAVFGTHGINLLIPGKEKWALSFGILIATEWHLVWAAVSGMETLLYALIVLAILIQLLNNIVYADNDYGMIFLGGMVGISVWLRPEGLSLFGPILFVILVAQLPRQKQVWKILSTFFGFGLIFLPYLYFNYILAGDWWPNTFYAKQAEYAILKQIPIFTRIFSQLSQPMIGVGIILLPGFIYIIFIAFQKKQMTILATITWIFGHFILYAMRLPVIYQHGRYGIPAMPVYFLIAFAGTYMVFQKRSNKLISRVLFKSMVLLIPLISLIFLFIGGKTYGQDVAFIDSEMVDVAKWISDTIPKNKIIAAHDIGAIGYFSNHNIVDLAGLISPEVIPFMRDEKELEIFLNQKEVDYLVTFPSWYSKLILQRTLVYKTDGAISLQLGGENMAVYCWNCSIESENKP